MALIRDFYAWLFCAFAALGACLYGYDGVYFTGVSAMNAFVEHFGERQSDGSYAIRASSLSLMTSVINIGELVGSLTAAPLNDLTGRKGVFFIASIMVVVGVILQLATDHKHSMIIGGRILLGYGVGNFSATSPLYIGVRYIFMMLWVKCMIIDKGCRKLLPLEFVAPCSCAGSWSCRFPKLLPPLSIAEHRELTVR